MPKLTLTLDTENQELSCSVDGTDIANINEINLTNYSYGESDPSYHFSVTTYEKVNELVKMTRLMAAESPQGKEAARSGNAVASKKLPGFIEIPVKTRAQEQIAALLRAPKR